MQTRNLGDLEVSVLGIGCNQFGPTVDAPTVHAIVDRALDLGVNFFDTADEYGPDGVSEELLGRAIAGRRDEVVIATKFASTLAGDPARSGASARWIEHAVEDSLRRLGTDRIDLYQQHFPDPGVDDEETLTAVDRLVTAGKVVHHGVCNFAAADVAHRCTLASEHGQARPVTSQDRYNLLRREALDALVPTLEQESMMLLPYFPLASGMLTGKYRAGEPLPDDSRFARHLPPAQAARIVERDHETVQRLDGWAAARGHSVAELALAWLASQPFVGSVIAGVSRPEQVEANAGAVAWSLTPDEVVEVAAVAVGRQGLEP